MSHKHLSDRVKNLTESATLEMTRKSRELKEQGKDVINLSIGEPDFNTPECIKLAAIEAIHNNITHYPPVSGYKELRKAISDKFKRENGLTYEIDQIVVSSGAKQSIANAMLCLVNKGDEVLIPAPYWVSYPEMVKLAEGVPVILPSTIANDFKVTADQVREAITVKTKVFIFSSPCNPSGSSYSRSELEEIAQVLSKKQDLYVISDEIYELMNFNGKHESIARFDYIKDHVVTINGVSKNYAMTGWRIGYMGASKALAEACNTLQGQYTSGASSISQMAALKALQCDFNTLPELQQMKSAFLERRNLVLRKLKDMPGVVTNIPEGAFYVFPDVSHYYGKKDGKTVIRDGNDLCLYLLDRVYVALVPGDAFGGYNHIRISYAASMPELEQALDRIREALSHLR